MPRAHRLGLMDHPGERRRIHREAVPRIGGLGVFAGLMTMALLASLWKMTTGSGPEFLIDVPEIASGMSMSPSVAPMPLWTRSVIFGLLGAVVVVVIGVLDDRHHLSPRVRLLAQVGAGLLLSLGGGVRLDSLGDLFGFGPVDLGPLAVPFTVFALVGIINAFNMIDGIDGLAAGLYLIAMAGLLWLTPGPGLLPVLLLGAGAALVPFLVRNLELTGARGGKVFLGDAGSQLLGYLLAWACVAGTQGGALDAVTALWMCALPLADTLAVMGRRMLHGQHPFSADRGHLHHLLSRWFRSTRRALVVLLSVAALLAGLGVTLQILGVPESLRFLGAMLIFGLYLLVLRNVRCWYRRYSLVRGRRAKVRRR
ncbi:MAG TPA: MraY family glycosyltransferase [Chromatiaceae bacterium]|nr:MraY family glycosyltransferase [Chromatiaceae bacterium]